MSYSPTISYAIQNRRRMWGLGYSAPMMHGALGAFGEDGGNGGDAGDMDTIVGDSSAMNAENAGPSIWDNIGTVLGKTAAGFVSGGGLSSSGTAKPNLVSGPPGSPSLVPGRPAAGRAKAPAASTGIPGWGWGLIGLGVLGVGYMAFGRR